MAHFPTAVTNAAGNAALVAGTTYYASLHGTDPGTTGANEFSGGGYARQAIVFATWASGATSNTAGIAIPNAGTVAANFIGFWDSATAGTYKGALPMAGAVTAASVTFAAGAVAPTVTG